MGRNIINMQRSKQKNIIIAKLGLSSAILCISLYFFSTIPVFAFENFQSENKAISEILTADIPLDEKVESDKVILDLSRISQGYISVRYAGKNDKVKIQISQGGNENNYNILQDQYEKFIVLPLHAGNGKYEVKTIEYMQDGTYISVFETSFEVKMENELLPFLYPSAYVPFSPDSKAVLTAANIAQISVDDMDLIKNIFQYISARMNYDEKRSKKLYETNEMYIPDIDEILSKKSGVCLDCSTLMAAMLRSQKIPAQVVIGDFVSPDNTTQRHAWVRAFVRDSREDWVDIDPTYGIKLKLLPASFTNQYAVYRTDYFY